MSRPWSCPAIEHQSCSWSHRRPKMLVGSQLLRVSLPIWKQMLRRATAHVRGGERHRNADWAHKRQQGFLLMFKESRIDGAAAGRLFCLSLGMARWKTTCMSWDLPAAVWKACDTAEDCTSPLSGLTDRISAILRFLVFIIFICQQTCFNRLCKLFLHATGHDWPHPGSHLPAFPHLSPWACHPTRWASLWGRRRPRSSQRLLCGISTASPECCLAAAATALTPLLCRGSRPET